MAASVIGKYTGAVAASYDAGREGSPKWEMENRWMAEILDMIPAARTVLDIPVGTGRFLPEYARRGMAAIGMDISVDMLKVASNKYPGAILQQADIFSLSLDGRFDLAVCVRFLNWVPAESAGIVLGKLAHAADLLIVTVATAHAASTGRRGKYIHAEAEFASILTANAWRIQAERCEQGNRMLLLEKEA